MTYRIRRKLISTKFRVNDSLCKVFFDPRRTVNDSEFWLWNVGFAIGKSNRQINDWYYKRKNKRFRSLDQKILGREGFKTISLGFKKVLEMRWQIPPGDSIVLDCTSGDPERQFKTWCRWRRDHPEWTVNEELKEFYWTRPPYGDDVVWKVGKIIPLTPMDPYKTNQGEAYFTCFDVIPN